MSAALYKKAIILVLSVIFLLCATNGSRYGVHVSAFDSKALTHSAAKSADLGTPKQDQNDNNQESDDGMFCAVRNTVTGNYIDLSQLSATPNELRKGQKSRRNRHDSETTRWLVRSPDSSANFTLGICSSATASDDNQISNSTGAYYESNDSGKLVSIGDFTSKPQFFGKKLTLKYANGDLCPNGVDRKATLLNFVCDKEIQTKAQISFIGSLHDCSYFFEVRSVHACATSHKSNDVNVLGIFVGIFLVFFIVEFGRRWFYRKMRSRLRPAHTLSGEVTPRWEMIESQSRVKSFFKRLFEGAARPAYTPIKLNSASRHNRSEESLARDMEAQNQLLDNLEVVSGDS
ncbi:LAMI_0D09098g1_1 [Lachancea mirantina]|uniref:LAMI_0D09098g1_1 n=1 Tax=Lachancea mirantina TaxID=1230905 RepID=A0A1G4JDE9_9SACH|nr:LAMI_0D09098g1_1 [Lachancea mirantina]